MSNEDKIRAEFEARIEELAFAVDGYSSRTARKLELLALKLAEFNKE